MDVLDLPSILGPIVVGSLIANIFFGCAVVQVYVYYESCQNDHWTLKALVTFEFLMHARSIVANCVAVYTTVVTNYGQPQTLIVWPQASAVSIIFSSPVPFGVQSFFVHRLYKFSNSMLLPLFCLILAVARLGMNLVTGATAAQMTDIYNYEHQYTFVVVSILVLSAVCDLTITAALCWNLKSQGEGVMKRTSLLVNRLVVWTIETGLVTSLTEVAELACFLTMRNNSVWMGISSVVSGIYLNSMLAALNRRSILRRDLPIVHDFPTGDLATKRFDNNMVTVDVIPSGVNEYPRCENHTAVVGTLNGFPQNR